ncbi:class I poly(R)-hydroxyalkanoic acid synthase [Massilia sp. W12]|uniref:class I poly(R)-hydroxyalkanoic acid synthase n=1 Tax=Massilia sp. W12 TaxID=3126507 RepID=UPI0030CC3F4B
MTQGGNNRLPEAVATILQEAGASIKPEQFSQLQQAYLEQFGQLWQNMLQNKLPELHDRRFAAKLWRENPLNAFNAASYLLNAQYLRDLVDAVQAPPKARAKLEFSVGQLIDAMSPANFFVTNPEAQQKLLESNGQSLTRGIANLFADLQKGRITQSDESAFEVGVNVATTEGDVVFENELFQLIQYKPLTAQVQQTPLLMVPPCINKFYILDLQPDNSLVRYAVAQGHTVFMVSWRNPDQSLRHLSWDDYIEQAALKAIAVVQEISGAPKLHCFGFCVGGTIIATALAVLAARGEHPAASLTLLTTFLDFAEAGVLEVFVDEPQVQMREQTLGQGGLMPGRDLAATFSSLRPNDLVWNYVQANYLKGEEPPPFDLLFWNGDSTNLPGPMFCWYLRNTYLENSLKEPGKLTVCGEAVDLGKIDAPVFIYASREDHIVPWGAAFSSRTILNPKQPKRNRFVLGASGHIAGVINSPVKKKRSHWVYDGAAKTKEEWLEKAEERAGSWWPEWAAFLEAHGGKQIKAPAKPGKGKYKPIEAAPGRYVKVRGD